MTSVVSFELEGSDARPIRGEARVVDGARTGIVLCHGFKGFAHWGFIPWLAERFADEGFSAVTFDFSGSGVGPDRESFTETEAFANDTFGKELHDLDVVMGEAARRGWIGSRAGLFGFSRGGGIAVLQAARDPRVGALTTWSAISSVFRWPEEEIERWRARGYVEVPNVRTGQVLRVTTAILDEVMAVGDTTLNIQDAASRIAVPWLIVHGTADETVPVHEGRQLHTASDGRAELALVERATHTYCSKHGMTEPTAELEVAADRTVRFFRANLA